MTFDGQTDSADSAIARAVALVDFGRPTAVKRGRDPRWPYVPVIETTDPDTSKVTTTQVLKRAYGTRDEAVACAARSIKASRESLARKLADPRYRALREQHGLPRDWCAAAVDQPEVYEYEAQPWEPTGDPAEDPR